MRERQEKAHGPYRRGRKWRVIETSATGARSTASFASEVEALAYIAEFNDEAEGRTVSGVLDAYLVHRDGDLKTRSIDTMRFRLRGILQVVARDRLLSQVTPAIALELYKARVASVAADTHRGELAAAAALFGWCVESGWLGVNPFDAVKPTGRKKTRKAHLRIDEARKFLAVAKTDATDAGLAAAMALLMGLRATEITDRLVRDVDDGARVLWIDGAKTDAGDRHLEVPTELRKRLENRIAGRGADERLFGDRERHWLGRHVRRLCKLAGVAIISPHGLRRTWSAIGAESMPVDAVSRALGHASTTVTRRHYLPTNAEERRSGAAVQRLVGPTP